MQLLFATGNSYKFSEVQNYLARKLPNLQLRQLDIDTPEVQESNPQSILCAKVDYIAQQTEKAFIVDDTSFLTERYDGFPGPYAKFINQTLGYQGWKRLFDEGDAVSAIALIGLHNSGETRVFSGRVDGILSFKNGAIDDTRAPLNNIIFIPELECFLGEALKKGTFKNHRLRALDELVTFLKTTDKANRAGARVYARVYNGKT